MSLPDELPSLPALPDGVRFEPMRASELPTLIEWAAAEGWNPGHHDVGIAWSVDPDAFVVVRDPARVASDADRQALEKDVMHTVDSQLGAVARPARVHFVNALPKTRSGKLLRRAMLAVCEGRDTGDLTTLEDPTALQHIKDVVQRGN